MYDCAHVTLIIGTLGLFSDEQPEDRSYMNIPKRQSQRQRDADAGLSYQNIPTPRPKSSVNAGAPPQPAKRMSTHNPDRQVIYSQIYTNT